MKNTIKKLCAVMMALAMLAGMIPFAAVAADYPVITAGSSVTVTLNGTYVTESIFKFIPEEDGTYVFWSYDNNYDTYGYILDSSMQDLKYDDDGGEANNFRVQYELVSGETYYLKSRFFTIENAGSFKVTVAKVVPATAIKFSSDEVYEVNAGYYLQFEYEFLPSNHIREDVEFTSSDPEVVRIEDSNGFALKAGTSTITVTTENGLTDSVTLTVLDTPTVEAGTEITFTSDAYDTEYYRFVPAEDGIYGFYSYNNTYDTDLILSSFADDSLWEYGEESPDGSERIQYELTAGTEYLLRLRSYSVQTFNAKIEKLVDATGVSIDEASCTDTFGTTVTPSVNFVPANAIREHYTFSVKDEDIASVNEDGTVSLHKIGTTEITVTTESGFSDTCTLTVRDYEDAVLENSYYFTPSSVNDTNYYRFIPETDGIYSFAGAGVLDTYGRLYDANGDIIAENDDYSNHNFWFSCNLTGGETYILLIETYDVPSPYTNDVGMQINMLDKNGNVIHDIEEYTYTDTEHSGYCNRCETDITANHSIDEDGLCICGFKHEHEFEYSYDDIVHEYHCKSCGNSFNEEHSFTDGVCVCGYTEHEHKLKWYDPSYSDDTLHESRCVICMLWFEEEHSFGDGGVCADCGYEDHKHVMDDNKYVHADYHDGHCSICDIYMYGDHKFGDDGVCVCGYTEHEHTGEYTYVFNDYHVLDCDICEFTGISEDHVLDDEGKCECGFVNHTHDFTEYYYENEGHCFKCSSCTALDDYVYSHYDEGEGKCECGYEFRANVLIGGTEFTDGQYLGTDGNVSDAEPEEWSAHFSDGVLTLKDLTLNVTDDEQYAIQGNDDLTIVVEGTVVLSTVDKDVIHIVNGDLTISGEGTMYIAAYGNVDGIDAGNNGDVTIDGPTVYIEAGDHGIEAEERFTMESGTVVIDAGDDGVDSEDSEINGGEMIIHAEDIGIDAEDNTTVNGGYINIVTNDEDGFEAGGYIIVNGGYIVIDADECGFNSQNDYVEINGGDIYIESDEGAISAYYSIYVAENMGTFESAYDDYDGYYYLTEDGEIVNSVHLTAEESDTSIKNSWITLSADFAEYTGEDHLPEIAVTDDDGKILTEGTDYTVTWSADKAVDIGVYYAIIEGTGDYNGIQYAIFTVKHTYVYVGGVKVYNGEYLANGETETTMEKPDGGFAYYADGVLTLNNFEYEGEGYCYDTVEGYSAVIYGERDLVIKVEGTNIITNTAESSDGISANGEIIFDRIGSLTINADYGIYNSYGQISVNRANIILNCTYTGIFSENEINVNSGAIQINAEDGMYCYGDVNINGGITVIDVAEYGIETNESINVNGGYTDITSGRIALQTYEFKIADGMDMVLPENGEIKCANGYCHTYVDGEVSGNAVFAADSDNMLYGDSNCDGKMNLSDVSLLMKLIAKWNVAVDEIASDVNLDGKINLSDASMMLKFIAGWDVTLGK